MFVMVIGAILLAYVIVGAIMGFAATKYIAWWLEQMQDIGLKVSFDTEDWIFTYIIMECIFMWPVVIVVLHKMLKDNDMTMKDIRVTVRGEI